MSVRSPLRRVRAGPVLALVLLLLVAGCGGDDDGGGGSSASSDSVVAQAKAAGVLKVGTIVTPPWVLKPPGATEYTGPEPLYVTKIAEEMGVRIEWVESSWETIIQGLQAKQFDLAAAPLNPTDERKQVADFVEFTSAGYCYLVAKDSPITKVDDLNGNGIDIATPAGTALITLMKERFPNAKISSVTLPPGANANAEDVLTGRHDATIINSPEVYQWEQRYADKLRVVPAGDECYNNPDMPTPIGVAVRKGDTETVALLQKVYDANKDAIAAEEERATQSLTES
jgi:ABC-type amino acid transport substrate-binding protein